MGRYQVRILKIESHTHDVLDIYTEKPQNYEFVAGQATKLYIDQFKWRNEGYYFAFACSPKTDHLEFLVKTTVKHDFILDKIMSLKPGDRLLIDEPVGYMNYKGKGTFIAGGVGITPFISMFKTLKGRHKLNGNKLIYANRTEADIIFKEELDKLLEHDFVNILEEETDDYHRGVVSRQFIKKHSRSLKDYFYVCGPPMMVKAVKDHLKQLDVQEHQIVT